MIIFLFNYLSKHLRSNLKAAALIYALALSILISLQINAMQNLNTIQPKSQASSSGMAQVIEFDKNWCSECLKMTPVMDEAKKKYRGSISFEKHRFDSPRFKELKQYFPDVKNPQAPMYIFFDKAGQHITSFSGAAEKKQVFGLLDLLSTDRLENVNGKVQVKEIKPPNLEIDHQGLATMVWYYADWCGFCQRMRPIVEKAKETYKGRAFIHFVNVDKDVEFKNKYRPQPGGIPYYQFYDKNGIYISDIIGALPEASFIKEFEAALKLSK